MNMLAENAALLIWPLPAHHATSSRFPIHLIWVSIFLWGEMLSWRQELDDNLDSFPACVFN